MSAAETAAVRGTWTEQLVETVRHQRERSASGSSILWPIHGSAATESAARILALYDIRATARPSEFLAQWSAPTEPSRPDLVEAEARLHQAFGHGPDMLVAGCNCRDLAELVARGYRVHHRSNGDAVVSWGHACR